MRLDSIASTAASMVRECIELDGAEAVIIGGGPLGQAAEQLQPMFDTPIIAPIPCAMERVLGLLPAGSGTLSPVPA
ncbi:Asp/Glu/hydantoin racemase [Aminobacter lissarensis]|uniref:Asp/Glu/hydantoin racemase n=1 Tax=Aminobacter carboxidus TaxID=376165 RepID=A0A8E2BC53_9HYPH|nr:Asp/Glu/hydantoin racemase [Aminobacter lissarensis]